jgi:hypothetical protein
MNLTVKRQVVDNISVIDYSISQGAMGVRARIYMHPTELHLKNATQNGNQRALLLTGILRCLALAAAECLVACGDGTARLETCEDELRSACTASHTPDACRNQVPAECTTRRLFDPAPAANVADCAAGSSTVLDAFVTVRPFRAPTVPDSELRAAGRALARYYARHALRFEAALAPVASAPRYLVTGSRVELDDALTAAGIPSDRELTPEEETRADRIVASILYRPLIGFLQEQALPAAEAVNLALVERVVEPTLAAELSIPGEITGFGFSPAFLDRLRESGAEDDLAVLLELPEAFTPSMFQAQSSLATDDYPDNAVAHEMGHALGLPHTDEPDNLMYPSVGHHCRATLSEEQLSRLVLPEARQQRRIGPPLAHVSSFAHVSPLDLHRLVLTRLRPLR